MHQLKYSLDHKQGLLTQSHDICAFHAISEGTAFVMLKHYYLKRYYFQIPPTFIVQLD